MRVVKGSRQVRRRQAMQRRIMEATISLLHRPGAVPTIDAVCRWAGCSKGGFYHHFPDRPSWGEALASPVVAAVADRVLPVSALLWVWRLADGRDRLALRRRIAASLRGLSAEVQASGISLHGPTDSADATRLWRLLYIGGLAQHQLWDWAGEVDLDGDKEAARGRAAGGI